MARGGYRPGSGPAKGTKYKKRTSIDKLSNKEFMAEVLVDAAAENLDPLTYMLKVMNDPNEDKNRRDRMAVSAAPYCHARKGEGQGKKEDKADRAKEVSKGKFSPSLPPKLSVVGN